MLLGKPASAGGEKGGGSWETLTPSKQDGGSGKGYELNKEIHEMRFQGLKDGGKKQSNKKEREKVPGLKARLHTATIPQTKNHIENSKTGSWNQINRRLNRW